MSDKKKTLAPTDNELLVRSLMNFILPVGGQYLPNPLAMANNMTDSINSDGDFLNKLTTMLIGGGINDFSSTDQNTAGAGSMFPGNPGNNAGHALASQASANALGGPAALGLGLGVEGVEGIMNKMNGGPIEQAPGDILSDLLANLAGMSMSGVGGLKSEPKPPSGFSPEGPNANQFNPINTLGGATQSIIDQLMSVLGVQDTRAGEIKKPTASTPIRG